MTNISLFKKDLPVKFRNKEDAEAFEGRIRYVHSTKKDKVVLIDGGGVMITDVSPSDIVIEKDLMEYALEAVKNGAKFQVDLINKTLKINKDIVLEGTDTPFLVNIENLSCRDTLSLLESLYDKYRNSIPSERDDRKKSNYFLALDEQFLTDEDLIYGEHRNTAQLKLELTLLLHTLFGNLKWDNECFKGCSWFWQSERCPNFVILKKWIEN